MPHFSVSPALARWPFTQTQAWPYGALDTGFRRYDSPFWRLAERFHHPVVMPAKAGIQSQPRRRSESRPSPDDRCTAGLSTTTNAHP